MNFIQNHLVILEKILLQTNSAKVRHLKVLSALDNLFKQKQGTYLPCKTSGARSPNLCMNSKKGRRVGNPAQLILIASKTPLKEKHVGYNQ